MNHGKKTNPGKLVLAPDNAKLYTSLSASVEKEVKSLPMPYFELTYFLRNLNILNKTDLASLPNSKGEPGINTLRRAF